MSSLFLLAARRKFRFPSPKGQLNVEQLFDLPLTSAAGASLDGTAKAINRDLQAAGEESFVLTADNSVRNELQAKLDVVREVIAVRQSEANEAKTRAAKSAERQRLLEALEQAERGELAAQTPEQLRRRLAELAD